jgi:hypothetical protein
MHIHIGWAAAGCAVSFVAGFFLFFPSTQDILDIQVAGVVIEHQMKGFETTNQAYGALESGDHERAKHILRTKASNNYAWVKDTKEIMESHVHALFMQSKLKQANIFLEQHKNATSLLPAPQENASNNSFKADGAPPRP